MDIQKHEISFEQAIFVFDDESRQERYDFGHSLDEDRIITIGNANGSILFVVETELEFDCIRIISARKVTTKEKSKRFVFRARNEEANVHMVREWMTRRCHDRKDRE